MGGGCSTAVEPTPRDIEVVGSNPAGCWSFSLLYLISSSLLTLALANLLTKITVQISTSSTNEIITILHKSDFSTITS